MASFLYIDIKYIYKINMYFYKDVPITQADPKCHRRVGSDSCRSVLLCSYLLFL